MISYFPGITPSSVRQMILSSTTDVVDTSTINQSINRSINQSINTNRHSNTNEIQFSKSKGGETKGEALVL